jgi:hypothetical protein
LPTGAELGKNVYVADTNLKMNMKLSDEKPKLQTNHNLTVYISMF